MGPSLDAGNGIAGNKQSSTMRGLHSRMFFILGRGRSGTTLISSLLDSHPKISVAPEAMFTVMMARKYSKCEKWDEKLVDSFMEDLFRERRIHTWDIDRGKLRREIIELGKNPGYETVCACVYQHHATRSGKLPDTLLGDKNPHYCLVSSFLMKLFPDARFIHVIRDPRDNVLSFRRVGFDLNSLGGLARRWCIYNREVLQSAASQPERFHILRFEDLLKNPEHELCGICDFLGIEYSMEMLDMHSCSQAIPDLPWHGKVPGPLDPDRAYSWMRGMTKDEACRIQLFCDDLIDEFDYPDACNNGLTIGFRHRFGSLMGLAATLVEKVTFSVPYRVAIALTNSYRRLTGSLPEKRNTRS